MIRDTVFTAIGGLVVVLCVAGAISMRVVAFRFSNQYHNGLSRDVGHPSEVATCRSAGYVSPVWVTCGRTDCFHCVDTRNELHPMKTPACNTHDTSKCLVKHR